MKMSVFRMRDKIGYLIDTEARLIRCALRIWAASRPNSNSLAAFSVRFLINLVLWPVMMIIYSIIAYLLLPWQWALPITLLLLPAPVVAHEMWRLFRLAKSDIKLLNNSALRQKYSDIRSILFNK